MAKGRSLGRRLSTGAAVATLAVASGAAVAGPQTAVTPPRALGASERVTVLVELTEEPTVAVYRRILDERGPTAKAAANAAAVHHLDVVRAEQRAFDRELAKASLKDVNEIYRLQRTYNGIALKVQRDEVKRIAALPGVKGVRPVTPKFLDNSRSMPFLGVPAVWESLGLDGQGIKVGIIDTGIDYIHVNFGGDGDYSVDVDPTVIETDTFPTTRVVGGWDFAGANYDPNGEIGPVQDIPNPDPDPMDFQGHGTHVAGTVGGYGVTTADETYAGPWDETTDMSTFKIGPGAAPLVDLYALKVLGDGLRSYATEVVDAAVEWATDPNQDGNFDDHLDVVNMSLGSLYGSSAEPSQVVYANAVAAGVVLAVAAGNSGDYYFVGGNPGSTPEVITVAASHHDGSVYPNNLSVLSPQSAIADYPAMPAEFGPTLDSTGVTGDLVVASYTDANSIVQTNGCDWPENDVSGKIAVIDRGVCDFTIKVLYAEFSGAAGVVIVNNRPGAATPMAFTDYGIVPTIPAVMIRQHDGDAIKLDMESDVLSANLNDTAVAAADEGDSIASFSSRGPSRQGAHVRLKPDVSAPGVDIMSSVAHMGSDGEAWGGTSMAAPHVTGIMALLCEGLPTWSPQQLKAALMNTANHDIYQYAPLQNPVSPSRAGAGRVDPGAALDTAVIAYDADAPESVSLSFHTLDVVASTVEQRTIRLENTGTSDVTYDVSYLPVVAPPGVTIAPASDQVTVPASSTLDVTVSLDVDAAALVRTHDATVSPVDRFWLSEASGYFMFEPASGPSLRVPAFAALRPASEMSATGPVDTSQAVDGVGTSTITLTGRGLEDDPATEPDPPYAVDSMVWPFELKYRGTNDPPWFESGLPAGYDPAESDLHEVRTVGVSSTVAMGDSVADSLIFFGVETEGVWGSPMETVVDIYIKAASAPDWQFVIFNFDFGLADQPSQCLVDLSDGSMGCFPDMLNFVGSSVHTPVFMSDVLVQWFPAGWLGLTDEDSAIEFAVGAYSPVFDYSGEAPAGTYGDNTPLLHYDVGRPALSFPGGFYLADLPDEEIAVHYDMSSAITNYTGSVMLLHHHNANGTRAEIVSVDGMTCTTDDDCPASLDYRDCDVLTGACVGCVDNTACLPGQICDPFMRECITDCTIDGGNPCAPGDYCDVVTGLCVDDCRQATAEPCLDGSYCDETTGQCQVANVLTNTTTEDSGDNCPNGGIRIDSGLDMNGNGVLDQDEITSTAYVCNGLETLVTTTDEPMGDNCEWGGQRIDSGVDDDGDGILDPEEIDETAYACNGPDGFQTLVTVTDEEPGDNCPSGGKRVDVGVDDNRNDVLDAEEIDETSYLCNALVSITESSDVAAGAACEFGGTLVQTGHDANGNGELDPTEVESHHVVCHGAPVPGIAAEGGSCSLEVRGRTGQSRGAMAALALLGLALVRRRQRR